MVARDYEKSSGNVFEDLEFENSEQELLKAKLAHYIHKAMFEKNKTLTIYKPFFDIN